MLLYCRTDCCENLDYFLSLSKSICNSIWSRINTVSCTDSLQRMMHTFVFKKKKSWETILVVEEPMTQHVVFNILATLKAVCILDQYSFPFSVLSIIAEQRLCILALALCCLLYVGIYSLVFFLQHFPSMNSHCRELDLYIQQFWIELSIQYWVHFLLVVAIKILSHGIIIFSTFGE